MVQKHSLRFLFILFSFSQLIHADITKFGYFWSAIDEGDYNGAVTPIERVGDSSNYVYRTVTSPHGNYIREYADHANVSWMISRGKKIDLEQLELAKKYNQKMIVDLSRIFYPYVKNKMADSQVKAELKKWWDEVIVKNGFKNTIYFIVPHDEPYHLFGANIYTGNKLTQFAAMAKQVTSAKLGVSFHPNKAGNTKLFVSGHYDYLGFYCYDADKASSKCSKDSKPVGQILSALESKSTRTTQKWFVLGPSSTKKEDGKLRVSEAKMIQRMRTVFEEAKKNPKVEFLGSFLWRGLIEKKLPRFGARDLNYVKEYNQEIGKLILAGKAKTPKGGGSSPGSSGSTSSSVCSVDDYLKKRQDVQKYWNNNPAVRRRFHNLQNFVKYHYNYFGKKEGMCSPR